MACAACNLVSWLDTRQQQPRGGRTCVFPATSPAAFGEPSSNGARAFHDAPVWKAWWPLFFSPRAPNFLLVCMVTKSVRPKISAANDNDRGRGLEAKRWLWAPASGLLRAPNSKGLVGPVQSFACRQACATSRRSQLRCKPQLHGDLRRDHRLRVPMEGQHRLECSHGRGPQRAGAARPSGRPQWPRKCAGAAPPSAFYAHHNRTGWSRRRCPKTVPPWGCCVPWV